MKVTVIAHTRIERELMRAISGAQWEAEPFDDDGSTLTEFAGRACYQSWSRPNPATATNEGYIRNVMEQGHFSIFEHATLTVYIEDVSRSLTHELVRHRHLSPSQLSQRFVVSGQGSYVVPPLYEGEAGTGSTIDNTLQHVWSVCTQAYDVLVAQTMPRLIQAGVDTHRARKMAREAARSVLPNMTPTAIVMTGNHRAWRHFLELRGTVHADAEIRRLAVTMFYQLVEREPNLYQDFSVAEDPIHGQLVIRNNTP